MSSVAFWYQTEPHKPWPALPPGPARLPFTQLILFKGHDAVSAAKHSGAPVEVQALDGVSDGKQLWFKPTDAQGWLELNFQTDKDQTVQLFVKIVHSWDYGLYRVSLDGNELARLDLYNPQVTPSEHKLGFHKLQAGTHTLRFDCVGKSPNSSGYFLGFDALTARVPVYSRDAKIDLRTLQKAN